MSELTACILWKGALTGEGYGSVWNGVRSALAHRVAYERERGPIPEGLTLDHLCRNRACVNPAHLEPVTNRENILRGTSPAAIHATKTHCPAGHPYTDENTEWRPKGNRHCRICRAAASRQRRECPGCGRAIARASFTRHLAREAASVG